tara:strand:- start:4700 stop:5122 length:423 start_codon:yes stop_codon:yes gene_type:complete
MKRKKSKMPKVSTVLNHSVVIDGEFRFGGGVHIDGKVNGNIFGEKDSITSVIIGENGSIEGDVEADFVTLNGRVTGDIFSKVRVVLAEKAKVYGTVHYNLLEMAMGAEVNGNLVHSDDKEEIEELEANIELSDDFADLNN